MKNRTLPLLTLSVAAFTPATGALAATSTHTYKGSIEEMGRWGEMQATIYVKNKKITDVRIAANPDTDRSQFIESNAFPLLRQETLHAQRVNVDMISGATDSSGAYLASVQTAIQKAVKAKTLSSHALK